MKHAIIAATAVLMLGPPAQAQQSKADSSIQKFVDQAAMTNTFEIEAAREAQTKAADPAYKDFATMIIADHTSMSDNLKKQVKDIQGVKIPEKLDQMHQQKLDQLKSTSGARFERQYRESQLEGHRKAIKVFREFSQQSNGQNVDLKSWAQASVPVLEKHLQRAENLPEPRDSSASAAERGKNVAQNAPETNRTTSTNARPDAQELSKGSTTQGAPSGIRSVDAAASARLTFYTVAPADLRASRLIGANVYNLTNENIGEIQDLIIDNGKTVKAVVIGVGGFLGIGDRSVAVQPAAVVLSEQTDGSARVVVNTVKDELKNAPPFNLADVDKAGGAAATTGASSSDAGRNPRK